MKQELDLRAILFALLRNIKWIVIAAVIGGLIGGCYAYFLIDPTYRSEFDMYVSNRSDFNTGHSNNNASGNISTSQSLAQEYMAVLKNDMVLDKVSENLQKQGYFLSNGAIRGATGVASVNETATLRVSVITTDPKLSQAICKAISEEAPQMLNEILEMGSVKPLAPAKIGYKTGPSLVKYAVAGAAAGAALVCVVVILVFMLDNTVTTERDLKKRLDVVVLGEIPSFRPEKKGEKSRG